MKKKKKQNHTEYNKKKEIINKQVYYSWCEKNNNKIT